MQAHCDPGPEKMIVDFINRKASFGVVKLQADTVCPPFECISDIVIVDVLTVTLLKIRQ